MKAKALNLKNMKETIVNYCNANNDDFTEIWRQFYSMTCMGFISADTWQKFFDQCHGWVVTDDGGKVVDMDNDDKIIHDFNNHDNNGEYKIYRA